MIGHYLPVSTNFSDDNFIGVEESVRKGKLVSVDYTLEDKPTFLGKVRNFFQILFSLGFSRPKDVKIENVFSHIQNDVNNALWNITITLINIKEEEISKSKVLEIKSNIDKKLEFLKSNECSDDLIDLHNGTITINGKREHIEMLPTASSTVSEEELKKALHEVVKQKQQAILKKGPQGTERIFASLKESEYNFYGQPRVEGNKLRINILSNRLKSSDNPAGLGSVLIDLDSSAPLLKLFKKSDKFESKEDLINKLERLSQLCEQQLNAGPCDLAETYANFQNTLKARISPLINTLIVKQANNPRRADALSKMEASILKDLTPNKEKLIARTEALYDKIARKSNAPESFVTVSHLRDMINEIKKGNDKTVKPISKEFSEFIKLESKNMWSIEGFWSAL